LPLLPCASSFGGEPYSSFPLPCDAETVEMALVL
jgi:hypothetical protein